jgi:hypothetical protein
LSATNSIGTVKSIDMTFSTTNLTIGDYYAGGLIFYLDNTGQHGLVCTLTNQGRFKWNNAAFISTGATDTTFGSGQSNTNAIILHQGAGSYAAQVCNDLVLNGYDDWFLPSKAEVELLFLNLKVSDLGDFGELCYWSSSEYDASSAWEVCFSDGQAYSDIKTDDTRTVRPIRAF